jgi:ABC-2 type transport system ATP-binding protein
MSDYILQVKNLEKDYGAIRALKGVSLNVPKGVVYGILGPNGSGKTTMLGIVMNVINQTAGSYSWLNAASQHEVRKQIGTLLETPNFYHYLNAEENLKIAATIKGKPEKDIDRVLQIVGLYQRKNYKFSTYSLGMKQRLAVASCLLGDPQILVLDEPTNGLDPSGIAEMRNLIKQLHSDGKTIIMASHLLDEVEKVCTHAAILKHGTLLLEGSVNEVFKNEDIIALQSSDNQKLLSIMQQFNGALKVAEEDGLVLVHFANNTVHTKAINEYCFNNGIVLEQLFAKKKSLESTFIEITQ